MSRVRTAVIWFIAALIALFSLNYQIYFNKTESLPQTLFIVTRATPTPKVGDYIMFKGTLGSKATGELLVKKVAGVAGDLVTIQNQDIYLNQQYLLTAKTESKAKRQLQTIQEVVIPAGKFFVYTPHPDSYDSRYAEIGLIDESNICGIAYPII